MKHIIECEKALSGAKILVTGGAGFIGRSLVNRLVKFSDVVVLDLVDEAEQKSRLGVAAEKATVIKGDVCNFETVEAAADGCTHIVHLASIAGVDTVMQKPVQTMEVITGGTMTILRVAEKLPGLKRLINFSTSEVFGDMAFKLSEGDPTALGAVGQSRWTYAVSKLMTEHLTYNYFKERNVPAASIRPFNIFGPGQIGLGAIHGFVVKALKGAPLEIHNDGIQIRAWCYIDDMVDGVILALAKDEAVGNSFNIGNPRSTVTIYNLAVLIKSLTNSSSEIRFVDWPFQDIELRVPNIDKAKKLLGFSPSVELQEGLLLTAEWYRNNAVV